MVTDKAYLLALKQECESSFPFFVKYFFKAQYGKPFIWSWHHQQISDVLMDVFEGRKTYVIINMPLDMVRRHLSYRCLTHGRLLKTQSVLMYIYRYYSGA